MAPQEALALAISWARLQTPPYSVDMTVCPTYESLRFVFRRRDEYFDFELPGDHLFPEEVENDIPRYLVETFESAQEHRTVSEGRAEEEPSHTLQVDSGVDSWQLLAEGGALSV